jgi:Ca-activated chloride channel homolog
MRLALCLALLAGAVLSTDLSTVAVAKVDLSTVALAEVDQTAAAPQAPAKPEIFRAGVELVSLNVTVVDSQARYVTDLEQADFSVFEDGAKQELTFFNRTNLPIALSLLIDSSASMEQRMEHAQEAAIGFAKRIRGQDLAQVVDFDSRVEIKQGFTNRVEELETAIRSTSPGGSTALHNAVYISLKELAKVRAKNPDEIRRQAIVVLSDGEDTSSLVSFEEVLELAKRSETAIYTIGLQPRETSALRGFREAEFVLRQLAQETGGRAFFAQKMEDLKDVYAQIADELSSQYSMGYASKNPRRDGAFRRLVVQVARPNTTARTKRGYYGPVS